MGDTAIRRRELAILYQIDKQLSKKVGANLGLEPPTALDPMTVQFAKHNHPKYPIKPATPEIEKSAALSMKVKPGKGTIKTRKVAFLVDEGVSKVSVDKLKNRLEQEGARAVLIAPRVGKIAYQEGGEVEVQHSFLTEASVCYDAFYTPGGNSVNALADNPDYIQFINEAYRHCKVIAFAREAESLAKKTLVKKDKGVLVESSSNLRDDFVETMKSHRVWEREKPRKVPV